MNGARDGIPVYLGVGVSSRCTLELLEGALAAVRQRVEEAVTEDPSTPSAGRGYVVALPEHRLDVPALRAWREVASLPYCVIDANALKEASRRASSRARRVTHVAGAVSTAEALALAAGGPQAVLLVPRLRAGHATCAAAAAWPQSGSAP